ncbi:MAG: hypothetical protein U0271_35805 [Polyangiaceae bacterium]
MKGDGLPWDPFAGGAPTVIVSTALEAWRQGVRGYHDLEHLYEMLAHLGGAHAAEPLSSPREVFVATLFHDAVYDPTRSDNEVRSAVLARETLHRATREGSVVDVLDGELVVALIDATARHGRVSSADVASLAVDAARFLDADMAILGAAPARYDRYVAGVRFEYAHVPADLFAAGRARFLRAVLATPSVFFSKYFRDRFEQTARANVTRELAALERGHGGAAPLAPTSGHE